MAEADHDFAALDAAALPSPCHVIDVAKLEANLRLLADIARRADIRVLLALKAFSCFALADLVGQYLHGTAASGVWEARLGRTRFKGEVHSFAPGLKAGDLSEIETLSDHLIFNTVGQFGRFSERLSRDGRCRYGIRVNPLHSEIATPLYDPCAPRSRLGARPEQVGDRLHELLSGIHVHALCDQGYAPFDRLLAAVEARFAEPLAGAEWINLGGGQLFTAPDYPVEALVARLGELRRRTGLAIYLEPGTAVALNAGALVTEVVDTGWNEGHFAVVDCSATCHMPDIIEAPYTPDILNAETVAAPQAGGSRDPRLVRLGGPTCLAGDVIGTYRFARPLKPGDRLVILDQAYYTMVKSTTFNGTPLPAMALWDPRDGRMEIVRRFGYGDFESRLS